MLGVAFCLIDINEFTLAYTSNIVVHKSQHVVKLLDISYSGGI